METTKETSNENINTTNANFNFSDFNSTLDYENSFDYVNNYYVNSFDYTIENVSQEDVTIASESKTCRVESNDDSIYIVHENGTDKHIEKKNKEPNKNYNKNSKKETKKQIQELRRNQEFLKQSNIFKNQSQINNNNYNNTVNKYNSANAKNFNNSNQTNSKNNSGNLATKIILFLIFLPFIISIFTSCLGGLFTATSIFE